MITVFGASGDLGRRIVRRLREAGHPVRAVARSTSRLGDAAALGATPIEADLRSPATLGPALAGSQVVVTTANAVLGRGDNTVRAVDLEGNAALVDAARKAGVRKFVFVSALGATADHLADFMRAKAATEARLRASGMPHILVQPSAFMEVWATRLGDPVAAGRKVSVFGRGRMPVAFVSAEDVARVTVAAAIDEGRVPAERLPVGGPEPLSALDVVQTFARVSGRPARIQHVPRAVLRVMGTLLKPVNPVTARLMLAALWMDSTELPVDSRAIEARFGPLVRLEDFARKRLAAVT
jgi:NADH dehydrogenase